MSEEYYKKQWAFSVVILLKVTQQISANKSMWTQKLSVRAAVTTS